MSSNKWIPLKKKLTIIKDLKSGNNAIGISIKHSVTVDSVNKIKQRYTKLCKKYKNSK